MQRLVLELKSQLVRLITFVSLHVCVQHGVEGEVLGQVRHSAQGRGDQVTNSMVQCSRM